MNTNSKTFFTRSLIESYVNFPLNGIQPIKTALGDYELLNYEQFMNWWNDYKKYSANLSINESLIKDSFTKIFTSRCQNLSQGYIIHTINSIFTKSTFDVLFAVYKKDSIIFESDIYDYQSRKSKNVGGFIVVEKGECKKAPNWSFSNYFNNKEINYNNVYSVFLICSSNDNTTCPTIKGQLLMGAYLFVIKSNKSFPQIAVLELLSGYTNIPGFISYSKLGFEKDLHLYGNNCFYSLTNLPMNNSLINKNITDIIQFVIKDVDIIISHESRKILNFYESNINNKENQEKLGILFNILYRIELEPNKILEDLIHVYDNDNNYVEMEQFFGENETENLTTVFYDKDNNYDAKFVEIADYEKCGRDDYRDCYISADAYPKIIEKIKQYYKSEINKMFLSNKTTSYDHYLGQIDCDPDDDVNQPPNKKCRSEYGGKRQKTNKKHKQYKKKKTRILKSKPKYKSKNKKTKTTKKITYVFMNNKRTNV
uniref:Uncharacterized protein n=1 Tax=viral metagenome TaxID=1070528 RepID=A0A6C0E3M6_9ZZZZ